MERAKVTPDYFPLLGIPLLGGVDGVPLKVVMAPPAVSSVVKAEPTGVAVGPGPTVTICTPV